jgi:hypothetical protein
MVDALAQQGQHAVGHIAVIAALGHRVAERPGQPQPLVELAHEQQLGVARDLAAVEGGRDPSLEVEAVSILTLCSHRRPSVVCRRLV